MHCAQEGALKTAAYASTAAWIASIAQILPFIGVLILLAGAYTAVSVVAVIL